MAGQEVRCRKCGNTFALPAEDNSAQGFPPMPSELEPSGDAGDTHTGAAETRAGDEAPQVEKFESNMTGGVGSAKSRMNRSDDVDAYDVATPAALGTAENPPFAFPYSDELDRLLPRFVLLLMLLWVAYEGWSWPHRHRLDGDPPNPEWTGAITGGWLLLSFVAVWLPLVYAGGRRGMSSVRLRIPQRRVMRMAAIASLPFGIAAAFWLRGEAIAPVVVGLILGCIAAAGLTFFLLRPNPRQLSSVLSSIFTCVALAAAITGGLAAGLSAIVSTTLKTYQTEDTFAQSPVGPGLPWREKPVAKAPEKPAPPAPKRPAPPTDPVVPKPPAQSPLIKRQIPLSAATNFERALFPRPINDLVAVQRRSRSDIAVEVYSLSGGRMVASATFPEEKNTTAAVSTSGELLARLASFPRLSVQVWSLSQKRVLRWFDLPADSHAEIIGFIGEKQVVVQSSRQKRSGGGAEIIEGLRIEVMDLGTGERRVVVSGDGVFSSRLAYSNDLSMVAYVLADANRPRLVIKSLHPSADLMRVEDGMNHDLREVDPALAAQPSAMVFSPDGRQLAAAFERDRQVVLMVYPAQGEGTIAQHLYPRTLELPDADAVAPARPMVWLADPGICVYGGTAVLNPETGAYLGSLGLRDVRQLLPAGPDRIIAEVGSGAGASLQLIDVEIKK
jgi:hypothetical protein